jgi:hypothetical protein
MRVGCRKDEETNTCGDRTILCGLYLIVAANYYGDATGYLILGV